MLAQAFDAAVGAHDEHTFGIGLARGAAGQAQEPPQRSPDPQPPSAPGNFPGAPSKKLPDFKSDHVMLVTTPRAVA